ncbi:MAG TPA: monooxygenase, partial [Myxococcota bacterium]|nr:monooxygenase [Myxococcota bacterium]
MIWFVLACTGTEESKPDSSPVYYGDVDAIIQEHCTRCHTTGGQAMSFDKAEDVQAMAPTILAYLDSGYMP